MRTNLSPKVRIRERLRNGKREVMAIWWDADRKAEVSHSLDPAEVITERDKREKARVLADDLANGRDPRTNSITLDKLIELYFEFCEGKRRPHTIRINRENIGNFRAYLRAQFPALKLPTQLRREHFEKYQSWCKRQPKMVPRKPARDPKTKKVIPGQATHQPHPTEKVSNRTVNQRMTSVKALLNWAADEDRHYLKKNPAAKIEKLPETDPDIKPINVTDEDLIYRAFAKGLTKTDAYAVTFKLALQIGTRPAELLLLTRSDVDWSEGFVHVLQEKTGKRRRVKIHPDTLTALRGIVAKYPGPTLLPITERGFQMALRRASKRAGVRAYRYLLRHTGGTRMLRVSDLRTAGLLLGHEDLRTTKRYTHLVQDDLDAATKRMWERADAEREAKRDQPRTEEKPAPVTTRNVKAKTR